jgi:hypothetical protein
MNDGYIAYGLALRSSFSLPGMTRRSLDGAPPSIELVLETPAELEAAWSGAVGRSPWRGQLGDGQVLRIEWGLDGDLRFAYGDRACFRLSPTRERLGCAPRDVAGFDWQRVLVNRILPNVSIAHGNEALHACAVETELGIVAIAAPSGTGKSTLAAELMRRGWPLFADDVLVLSQAGGAVEAQAATPHMNISAGAGDPGDLGETLADLAGESWLAVRGAGSGSRELAAVVVLERGPGLAVAAGPLRHSPLALAPYMLGLPDDEGRHATRFTLYADLAESIPLIGLRGGPEDRPATLADALEGVLGLSSAHTAGATV